MPSRKTMHVNRFLTNMSVQFKNAEAVNEALFPSVIVQNESDEYPIYDQAMLFTVYETRRANGARANEIDWKLSTPGVYKCIQHSLKDIVTDRERDNADQPINPDIDSMEFLQQALDLEKEYRAAQLARNTANYLSTNHSALSGTSQWSDYTNGKPLNDIRTMRTAVFQASRMKPNTIVLPWTVAETLSFHPTILDLIKYTHDNILLQDSQLPSVLFGMKVIVAGAGYNTANAGQAAAIADVWGKDVICAYVDPGAKLKSISFGKTFRKEKYVRKWRDEEREGDMVECNDINVVQMVAAACGYLLQTAVA